jgi:hypothetical protein
MAEEPDQHAKLSRRLKGALDKARAGVRKPWLEAEWVLGKRTTRALGLAATLFVAVVLLVLFLDWYVAPTEAAERKDVVQAIGILLAALVGLGGLYFTRRSTEKQLQQARESQARTQESAQNTLRLTEQGQITDRFTKAIEQLGSDNLVIRLGGIYALERIAGDSLAMESSPGRDYSTVVEVLTAYVRDNASLPSEESTEPTTRAPNETAEQSEDDNQEGEGAEERLMAAREQPRTDIQVILAILGRRKENLVPEKYRRRLDLRKANLAGSNLVRANLRKADLSEARLSGADLSGAHLPEASLAGADLRQADLRQADLSRAILREANLSEANLLGASLSGAILSSSKHLTQVQVAQALGDETTQLPEGLHPPASWAQGEGRQIGAGAQTTRKRAKKGPGRPKLQLPWSSEAYEAPGYLGDGSYIDLHPTRYNWRPDVEELARYLVDNYDVWCNTYVDHPPGWSADERSIDVWGPGGRGHAIDPAVGQAVFNYVFDNPNPPSIHWTIWWGWMWSRAGLWEPAPEGPAIDPTDPGYYRHIHYTFV